MIRRFLVTLSVLALAATPALGQQHQHGEHQHGQGHAMHRGGEFPAGWSARTDRDAPVTQVHFMAHGEGFHAITGPAAVFYNPEWRQAGDYGFAARLEQRKAPEHPEAYGLIIGGKDLDAAEQRYSYFLVRQTGEYFIATRRGAERVVNVAWTANPAIRTPDAAGRAANLLGVEVRGNDVVFSINGTEVTRRPRAELETEGLLGFRINHRLDVMVDQIAR